MVETLHLQPPASGPQSDPLLFGVAEALARLFPLDDTRPRLVPDSGESKDDERAEEPPGA